MYKDIKLLIVPSWIEAALQANNLPIRAALDVYALSRILSFKDVCFYTAVNAYLFEALPNPLKNTFQRTDLLHGDNYLMSTPGGFKPAKSETDALVSKLDANIYLEYKRLFNEKNESNLGVLLSLFSFMDDTKEERVVSIDNLLFEVFDIKDTVLGIRFKLADKHIPFQKQLKDCLDDTLKIVVERIGFREAVKLPIFEAFTRLARTHV